MKSLLIALILLNTANASEIDQFKGRDVKLQDALETINSKANTLFEDAIIKANEDEHDCSEKPLYKELRKKFRNQYTSEFSKWLVQTDEIEKISTKTSESIYRDFTWYQAIVIGLFSKISDPAGQTMRVNGVFIGTDKFEHFLGSGYNYFKKHFLKEKSLKKAMKIGLKAETGLLGAYTTGVMSYADMVANFNGMRFWNTMLGKRLDPLTGLEVSPYLTCDDGKWKKLRNIDFSVYIDNAWDEGINCSWLRTESMVTKVKKRLEKYSKESNTTITCPMEPEKLQEDGEKYANLPINIINYEGHKSLKENKDQIKD